MSAFEDERTEHLASAATTFAPETAHDERTHDIASLRILVRKYGHFVEWAAAQIVAEPEWEKRRNEAADADAEIARRLSTGEELSGGQICWHVHSVESERTPERLAWWIDHVLDRAGSAEPDQLEELLLAAVRLLGRCPPPRETWRARWQRVAALNTTTHHGLRRELKRQGVIT
jgi:hypothetical protein